MNLRNQLIALIGSVAMFGPTMMSSVAQLEDKTTVEIQIVGGGSLSVSISESLAGGFSDVSYNFTKQLSAGTLVVTVVDERGIASGWNVFVSADDFSGSSGVIDIQSLDLIPGQIDHQRGNVDLDGLTTFPVAPVSTGNTLFWSASGNFGDGEYNLPLVGIFSIPVGTLVGVYTSTLTVTVSDAMP